MRRICGWGIACWALIFAAGCGDVEVNDAGRFKSALLRSRATGRPVLVDFFTDWCPPCKQFDADLRVDADLQSALSEMILLRVDCEKGEGVDLSETYDVRSYPTFVLIDAAGETLYRWSGYAKEAFIEQIGRGLADLDPVDAKVARFRENPDTDTALALAADARSRGALEDAIHYLEFADGESGGGDSRIAMQLFRVYAMAEKEAFFQLQRLPELAEHAIDLSGGDMKIEARVLSEMVSLASDRPNELDLPGYLKRAHELTEIDPEAFSETGRGEIRALFLLRVEGDTNASLDARKAALGAGWEEDPSRLNEFAWWCFEQGINLPEAETLSRRGVSLAEAGRQRAMIIDTVAEIVNLRGDPAEAARLMAEAVKEEPDGKHYRSQLERFEELAAEQRD